MPDDFDKAAKAAEDLGNLAVSEFSGSLENQLSGLQEEMTGRTHGPSSGEPNPVASRINTWLTTRLDDLASYSDTLREDWGFSKETGVAKLSKPINLGNTKISVKDFSATAMEEEWKANEGHNRVGFVEGETRISDRLPEFVKSKFVSGGAIIELTLEGGGVQSSWLKEFYENKGVDIPSPLSVPRGTPIANFHKGFGGNLTNIEDAGYGVIGRVFEETVDLLEGAVRSLEHMDTEPVMFVCCLIRQLAAWDKIERTELEKALEAGVLDEDVRKAMREVRTVLCSVRLILTLAISEKKDFSIKMLTMNIFKIMVDSLIMATFGTLQVLCGILKRSIYAWAMKMLKKYKIQSCMPFLSLIQLALSKLFGREGILAQLISYRRQTEARMSKLLGGEIQEDIKETMVIEYLTILIQLMDALIDAGYRAELCVEDILDDMYDTTKEEIPADDNISAGDDTGGLDRGGLDRGGLDRGGGDAGTYIDNPMRDGFEDLDELDSALRNIMSPSTTSTALGVPSTGETAPTLNDLLISGPTDAELERFMIARLGVDPATARDAVYRSRVSGDCAKGLTSAELREVYEALEDMKVYK